MLLHELLRERRDEVVAACRAELGCPYGLHDLARYFLDHFDDIAELLKPNPKPRDPAIIADFERWIVGDSVAAIRLRIELSQLAHQPRSHVLLWGEAGTGRRHCARALHAATYPSGPLLQIDDAQGVAAFQSQFATLCASPHEALPDGLTLYVRDLCALSAADQRALLPLARAPELRLRLIASSSLAPDTALEQGRLCPELRVHFTHELRLPTLFEHRADIPALARHFAARESSRTAAAVSFNDAALRRLAAYDWPGNVAELERLIAHLSSERAGAEIDVVDLERHSAGVLLCER